MKVTKWASVAAASSAVLLALTGCSSDSSSSSDALTGDPVKIMAFGSFSQPPFALSQIVDGAQAAVDHVNANGGVSGHPLELVTCDDNMTPDGAAACGKEAVSEDVVAVVGSFSLFGDAIVPQLEEAGIPYVLPIAISPGDAASEQTFSIMSAGTPLAAALPILKEQGCKTAVMAAPEGPASEGSAAAYGIPASEAAGIKFEMVTYPATTTDYTSVAQQIADKGNCVIYGGGAPDSAALIIALSQMGDDFINMPLSTIAFPESVLSSLGEATANVQVASPFNFASTGNEAVVTAVEEMQKINPKVNIDDTALNAYAAVITVAQAGELVDGDITAASLSAVLSDTETEIDTGLYAPTNFASAFGWFPAAPRVAGSVFQLYEVKDGKYVPKGDAIDISKELKF